MLKVMDKDVELLVAKDVCCEDGMRKTWLLDSRPSYLSSSIEQDEWQGD